MLENAETITIILRGQTKIRVFYTDSLFESIRSALNVPGVYTLNLTGEDWPMDIEIPISEVVSVKVKRICVEVLFPNRE